MTIHPRPEPSTFSTSICDKILAFRRVSTQSNALWILRNPIKLTPLEFKEVMAIAKSQSTGD